jgi:hypothetical protein
MTPPKPDRTGGGAWKILQEDQRRTVEQRAAKADADEAVEREK